MLKIHTPGMWRCGFGRRQWIAGIPAGWRQGFAGVTGRRQPSPGRRITRGGIAGSVMAAHGRWRDHRGAAPQPATDPA